MTDQPLLRCFVDGQWVETSHRFPNINPVNGQLIGRVCEADAATVSRAVEAAKRASEGTWKTLTVQERASLLHRIADGIEQRFEEFVMAEVRDTGRPVHQARSLDVARGIANFRMFADLIKTSAGELYESALPDGTRMHNYVSRKPLGTIAVISPWNLPLLLLTWKVAPALAMGNCVVAKPSEETPSSATLLAEVIQSVGLPHGVFNLVHGFGPGSAGEHLSTNPNIDAITFTGESRTGATIMKAAAEGVKEVSFELGGKNAAVVFADADFDAAVAGVMRSSFTNSGQVCLCTERVYIERPIFDRFVAELTRRCNALVVGRPDDPDVDMGPLVSLEHRSKVHSYYRLAREEGATILCGGDIPVFGDERDQGAYIQPTIIAGLPDTARCMREEIFGPVCHVAPFDTEEEIVERVNDSVYGLAASVWTTHLSRAHRVAGRIHTGIVWVNAWFARDLRTPFGGTKMSGLGREGGRYSLDFYSEISTISIKI
jgi:aminomuconate-semialdehyde/2-hydroxymuconate-6-semialdehyde dehydrogenase